MELENQKKNDDDEPIIISITPTNTGLELSEIPLITVEDEEESELSEIPKSTNELTEDDKNLEESTTKETNFDNLRTPPPTSSVSIPQGLMTEYIETPSADINSSLQSESDNAYLTPSQIGEEYSDMETILPYSSYMDPSQIQQQELEADSEQAQLEEEISILNKIGAKISMYFPIMIVSLGFMLLDFVLPELIGNLITFISFFLMGAISVFYEIPNEWIDKLEENKYLKAIIGEYLEMGKNINEKIKSAIDKGDFKGAILFSKGMIMILFSSMGVAIVSIILTSIKNIFYPSSFEMFSSFSFLYGAGVAALIRWVFILRKEKKEADALAENKEIKNFIKTTFKMFSKIYVLIFGMMFWGCGLYFYIMYSPEQMDFIMWTIMIPAIGLMIVAFAKFLIFFYKTNKKMK